MTTKEVKEKKVKKRNVDVKEVEVVGDSMEAVAVM